MTPCYNVPMPKPNKTIRNPHGLSVKQKLVVEDMIEDVASGKGLNATKSHLKFYNTQKKHNAGVIAHQNFNKVDFREALVEGLKKRKIIGANSKIETRLAQGLDAETFTPSGKVFKDYKARLDYIKEINKIQGVYAPEKRDIRKLNINLDADQLDAKISQLQKELKT